MKKSLLTKRTPKSASAPIEPLEARIAPAFTGGTFSLANFNGGPGTNGSAFHGETAGDQTGQAVSAAGDINGDGFGDFIVGGPGSGDGVAYVVLGQGGGFSADQVLDATFLDGRHGFKIISGAASPVVGYSVSAAGDVNGDGFDDLIVSAPAANSSAGAAYVIFGREGNFGAQLDLVSLDGKNGFELRGVAASDYAGFSVGAAGDVNGDGFADVIVGASAAGGTGRAYVFFGKASGFAASVSLDASAVRLDGASSGDQAGFSVSGAGDVNGDGFADVIVGAPGANGQAGAAYVVFGGSDLDAVISLGTVSGSAGFRVTGATTNDYSGISVSAAGDVNGDGLADVIIGAPGFGTGGGNTSPGAAYVILGNAAPYAPDLNLGTPGIALRFDGADNDTAGVSVKTAGDVNGDGIDDLIIGASHRSSGGAGNAYVVFGRTDLASKALTSLTGLDGFQIVGEEVDAKTGRAVSGAGDVNGDGFADLLIGAPYSDDGGTNKGQAYLVLGGPSGVFITATVAPGGKTATFTDVDGDIVTIKTTKGTLVPNSIGLLAHDSNSSRAQLTSLELGPDFEGADITITAKKAGGGDGKVNVGAISAAGLDLGKVTVGGDLGAIFAGDTDAGTALKSLTVGSLGTFGGRTADTRIGTISELKGPVGAVKIAGDVAGAQFVVSTTSLVSPDGTLASVTVGGSVLGLGGFKADRIGTVKISGDVHGLVSGDFGIRSITLGGSLVGGLVENSGVILSQEGPLGSVTIGGDVRGGAGLGTGVIGGVGVGKLSISGDLVGGAGAQSGGIVANASPTSESGIAGVTIGGDLRAGTGSVSGFIAGFGEIGPVLVKGDIIGTSDDRVRIFNGGTAKGEIKSVTVGGDLVHTFISTGTNGAPGSVGSVTVGGDWIASSLAAGVIDSGKEGRTLGAGADSTTGLKKSTIGSVTIKGSARGTIEEGDHFAIVSEEIGSVSIGGVKLALTKSKTADPANDITAIHVGPTPDFVVREISRLVPQPGEPATSGAGAGTFSAYPAQATLGASGSSMVMSTISGVADSDQLATSLSAAGDINGDGFGDFILGAPREGANDRGAAYVILGKAGGLEAGPTLSSLSAVDGFKIIAAADGDYAGIAVSAAGDVNGDGFADVIVGASKADEGGTNRGAAYVIFGRPSSFGTTVELASLDGVNGFKLSGVANGDFAGFAVGGAGDVNGDGFDDVIVGAPRASEGGTARGAAYVYFGKAGGFLPATGLASLDGANGFKVTGTSDNDFAGRTVSGAGDLDGDGFADLIVGADSTDTNGTDSGTAYIIKGKRDSFGTATSLDSIDGFSYRGFDTLNHFGYSVSAAGDVNGDGFADLIVGATGAYGSDTGTGAAYVVFGRADLFSLPRSLGALDGSNGFNLGGVTFADNAGAGVKAAGDINGDGFSDLVVGAPLADENGLDSGAAYVVFGKASGFTANVLLSSLDGSNGFKLRGAAAGDRAGTSVSAAGDIDGDGYADFLVGATRADDGGTDRGAAYIVYGKPSGEFIAPAFSADHKTATWTDMDGDLVTLKVSKGTLDTSNFLLLANSTTDARARLLMLSVGTSLGGTSEFDSADITLTAKRAGGGDGKVNLGTLNAANTDLGAIKISGDLGQMFVGDSDDAMGLKSLTIDSTGIYGGRTQPAGEGHLIFIAGPAGPIKIAGDVKETRIVGSQGGTPGTGNLTSITIGGSVFGGAAVNSGAIGADVLGTLKIAGDLVGGAGASSGHVLGGVVGSFTLGGSMIGGRGPFSSGVQSFSTIGSVSIGGSQVGGEGDASAAIFAGGNVGKVSIARDQVGGGIISAIIFAGGSNIASVTIGGDVKSGSSFLSGGILAGNTLGPVTIKGDVLGTAQYPYTIRGSGPQTGTKSVAITSLTVGGDLDHALILGGYGSNNAAENGHAQIGPITVGGDWIASSATAGLLPHGAATSAFGIFGNGDEAFINAGPSGVVASIASITIKGRAVGSLEPGDFYGIVAEKIGPVTVGSQKYDVTNWPIAIGPTADFFATEVVR